MIRLIRGRVAGRGKDHLIVDIGSESGGLGYQVFTTEPILAKYQQDSAIQLHTYLQVREDILALYGLDSLEELEMFILLLGVNGVGPKVALATLSTLGVDALSLALANEEPAVVARVPGIGKRTAQKVILELKDKVKPTHEGLAGLSTATDEDTEVIEALVALGYSVVEAQRAVQQLPKDVSGIEERLRLALSHFQ